MTKANEVYVQSTEIVFFCGFCKILHFHLKKEKKCYKSIIKTPFSCNQLHNFEHFSEKNLQV